MEIPYAVGALYNRKREIHGLLGGQQQGGICTPRNQPFIIAFTGEAGALHGYADFWDDNEVLHYFGEGQKGDMSYSGGNLAIENHVKNGKKLLLFQMMGKGKGYRYLGEFISISSYVQPRTLDRSGTLRDAIVFRLRSITEWPMLGSSAEEADTSKSTDASASETTKKTLVEVRTKQRLFRERLVSVEKGCRLTGIEDLRFLRASHIKPWSSSDSIERTDGHNGLLLTPTADLLFDQGWISFKDNGTVLVSEHLPSAVVGSSGFIYNRTLYSGFSTRQRSYLEFHRDSIYQG